MSIAVYTDGSATPNPGYGGAGIVVLNGEKVTNEITHYGGWTTNNKMELTAVILAFEYIPSGQFVTIYTDSEYVCKGINEWIKGWEKKSWKGVKNVELWQKLLALSKEFPLVKIEWVKGHADNKWNVRADELANKGRKNNKDLV